jgi:hypothetical protein
VELVEIMGLLEFLKSLFSGGSKLQCPSCGTIGAQQDSQGGTHCKNPSCPYFDPGLLVRGVPRKAPTTVPTQGNLRPTDPLTIQYRNFAGQERSFVAERESVVRKKNHLVARVAPTGAKIALSRDRIQNLSEVEARIPQRIAPGQDWPSPRERQVLSYHKKHESSSPLYEKIRAKYPNW